MLCDHCGDCYELLTDVRVLNALANVLGGNWTVDVCRGWCRSVAFDTALTRRGHGADAFFLEESMPTIRLLVAVLALTPVANLAAQRAELRSGARVRVWAPSLGVTKQVGTLVRIDADSVVLMRDSQMAMPRDSVTRLEVSHGYSSPAPAALYGAATIGGVVLLVGLASTGSCGGSSYFELCLSPADVLLATAVWAGVGAVAGLVIGSLVSVVAGERWRSVAMHGARAVAVTSQRDGRFGLGFSVAF